MDYTVDIERLWTHGSDVAASATEASAVLSAVRLDGAATAMPGSLSAGAATRKQASFRTAADSFVKSLEKYSDAARSSADGYRRQEDSATGAIRAFFGG